MTKVLIIEDEANVRRPLANYLTKDYFAVTEVATAKEADEQIDGGHDIILLDWMLPDGQGIELLKKWRSQGKSVPVILLTARTELVDKVLGFEFGADDYITKPFEPRELVARIRARVRQSKAKAERPLSETIRKISRGGFVLCPSTREVFFEKNQLDVTKTEFQLLELFLNNPNQVFSREELLKNVWGYDQYPTTRTVDTHVMQLRQKSKPELFETVHGIGYRFKVK